MTARGRTLPQTAQPSLANAIGGAEFHPIGVTSDADGATPVLPDGRATPAGGAAETPSPALSPPRCRHCGKTLVPHPGEAPYHFRRRQFCGRSCNIRHTRRPRLILPPKACKQCGTQFAQRANEYPAGFRHRKCCSPECTRAWRELHLYGRLSEIGAAAKSGGAVARPDEARIAAAFAGQSFEDDPRAPKTLPGPRYPSSPPVRMETRTVLA